ncbi:MAG: hypothetical protein L3J00_05160 [Thiomicrorhabdus sp.]|nr:hypothetical protein [Thiomicrorhabdus sp.]
MNDVKLNGMRELNFNEIEEVSGGFFFSKSGDFQRLIKALFPKSKPSASSSPSVGTTTPPAQSIPAPPPPQVINPFALTTQGDGYSPHW